MSGVVPAIPLMIIRPFLPESPAWAEKKRAGTLKRPSFGLLFQPAFRRTTIVTTIMMACAYAAAFGAIQQMPRIVPGLAEVRALARTAQEQTVGVVQSFQEIGGLAGRIALAYLAVVIISRRRLLHVVPDAWPDPPADRVLPHAVDGVDAGAVGRRRWSGFMTVAQFSFWGNYLPRVYPTHLRGTGESFAANIGGRMIGTFGAQLAVSLVHRNAWRHGADQAGLCMRRSSAPRAYVIGFIASFFLPEPKGRGAA